MEILIPFKTPTVNHLYYHRGNIKVLIKEARVLREEILKLIPVNNEFTDGDLLEVEVYICENWFCRNGDIKRKDISNREKFLLDSVFQGLNLNDKQIFKHSMFKVQSEEEKTIIKIKKIINS